MKIAYKSRSGGTVNFSEGLVRASGLKGIGPQSEGGSGRTIVVDAVVCGDFERSHRFISEILGLSDGGKLEIETLDSVFSAECSVKSVSSGSSKGINTISVEFICPSSEIDRENTDFTDTFVQICGSFGSWEFDDWELTEENGTELSAIFTGNSAFVPNNTGFDSGCIITVELQSYFTYVSAVNAKTKEFAAVKGNFAPGDIIIFRCIDGEKGIFLSSVSDNRKYENITHRIVWGSSFFKIQSSGARVFIKTNTDNKFVTANIRTRGLI